MTIDPVTLSKLIQSTIIGLIAIALFFGLKGRLLRLTQRAGLPRLALQPVRVFIRYAVLVAAFLLILGRWGFQINGIVAVLGTILGIIGIGFVAMWSMLSNFLCTFVLILSKPFSVGDEIELPAANVKGTVADVSVLYTVLESAPGETVMVPNNTFFQVIFKRRVGATTTDLATHLQLSASTPAGMPASTVAEPAS